MRILFADTFPQPHLDEVRDRGHTCAYAPHLTSEDLPAEVDGHDVLVVRGTRVTAGTIAAAGELNMIIRAGSGTNTIDTQAAADRDIHVCNVPGGNAVAVAELAFALVMALDRNIPDNVADLRAGRWDKKRYASARGLYGRTVGVVGLGSIGLAFAERAAAFGLTVHAVDKAGRAPEVLERARTLGIRFVPDLETLARTCEILSFHVPAGEHTKHLIGSALLRHVQPGAWIINTSRGELVDDEALLEAMDTKGVRAGLDVYNGEPASGQAAFSSALARHPNVYGTHHIGASTEQAQHAIAAEVVRMLEVFDEGRVLHCVNQRPRTPASLA